MIEDAESTSLRRSERATRRRTRADTIETWLIVALAGLVLFKGAPAIGGIATGIGEMMLALTRL